VPLFYKGELIAEHRPDLIVENEVIVEIKSKVYSTDCAMAHPARFTRSRHAPPGILIYDI